MAAEKSPHLPTPLPHHPLQPFEEDVLPRRFSFQIRYLIYSEKSLSPSHSEPLFDIQALPTIVPESLLPRRP